MRITKYKALIVKDSAINYESKHGQGDAYATSPELVGDVLRELFHADKLPNEQMWEVCINAKGRVVGAFELATGTATQCVCDVAAVVRNALLCGAYSVILAHNHPSGDSTPSREDISTTDRVKNALKIVGLSLVDHLIIGDGDYSMREHGLA